MLTRRSNSSYTPGLDMVNRNNGGKLMSSKISSIWGHFNHPKCADFGAHSDWSKFEMERSDWSCAYCRKGAPLYNLHIIAQLCRFWGSF